MSTSTEIKILSQNHHTIVKMLLWLIIYTGHTLREDQPLRLLLNLLSYHFNPSEPTYKSQRIKLLDVIALCNQLNVNALNEISITIFLFGEIS